MITLFRKLLPYTTAAVIGIICNCTGPLAGSETTSGVKIAVAGSTVNGTTTPGATVSIFDAHYSPDNTGVVADTALADDNGLVAFVDLPDGTYNVFVFPNETNKSGAAVLGIPVGAKDLFSDSADFTALRTITGTITRQGQPDSLSLVYIAGSPFNANTDSQGDFRLNEVPVGSYTLVVMPQANWGFLSPDSVNVDISETENAVVNVNLDL